VKTPKRASRDGAAARGAAPRGPTCTARPDLPANGFLAGRSGLAVHLAPTRRPVRPPRGRFGRVWGSPEADFGPASPQAALRCAATPDLPRGWDYTLQFRARRVRWLAPRAVLASLRDPGPLREVHCGGGPRRVVQRKVGLSGRRAATRSSSTPRLVPTTWETRSRRPLVRRASGDARLERSPKTTTRACRDPSRPAGAHRVS